MTTSVILVDIVIIKIRIIADLLLRRTHQTAGFKHKKS